MQAQALKVQAKGHIMPDGLNSYNLSIIRIIANTMAAKPHTPITIESILSNIMPPPLADDLSGAEPHNAVLHGSGSCTESDWMHWV